MDNIIDSDPGWPTIKHWWNSNQHTGVPGQEVADAAEAVNVEIAQALITWADNLGLPSSGGEVKDDSGGDDAQRGGVDGDGAERTSRTTAKDRQVDANAYPIVLGNISAPALRILAQAGWPIVSVRMDRDNLARNLAARINPSQPGTEALGAGIAASAIASKTYPSFDTFEEAIAAANKLKLKRKHAVFVFAPSGGGKSTAISKHTQITNTEEEEDVDVDPDVKGDDEVKESSSKRKLKKKAKQEKKKGGEVKDGDDDGPITMLGGTRGDIPVAEKIRKLKKFGVKNAWYVDGSTPADGPIVLGESMHALSGPAAKTYAAFDHSKNPNLIRTVGKFVVLKNTPKNTASMIKTLE
jgi:energy-coupling factor transporter ATP-binding protein EcfA2